MTTSKNFNKTPRDKLHLCLLQKNDISLPYSNKIPNLEPPILLVQLPHIPRDYLHINWETITALSLLEPRDLHKWKQITGILIYSYRQPMMLIKALRRIVYDLLMFLHAGFWSPIRILVTNPSSSTYK